MIDDSQVDDIKSRFTTFFDRLEIPGHAVPVDFNQLVVDGPTEDDACIMILSAENPALMQLQHRVLDLYGEFRDYRQPELEEYERHFKPHLTIIDNLDAATFKKARSEVKEDYRCQGVIEEVVLAIVPDATIETALNSANLTIARL